MTTPTEDWRPLSDPPELGCPVTSWKRLGALEGAI